MATVVSPSEPLRSCNQYLIDIINYKKSTAIGIRDYRIQPILSEIKEWAGDQLFDIFVTGSSAKGTSLKGNSDLDLFISLKANTSNTLKEIFDSLFKHLANAGFKVEKRNVAQRLRYKNLQIDIVPGKKIPNQSHWHYLYTNRWSDTNRIQTNVQNHVNVILNSNRLNEIIALKIWRQINKLEFPSMYLELYTIKSLSGKWSGKSYLSSNFLYVLDHIAKYFLNTAIYDPSNSANTISNSLYKYEKEAVLYAAQKSLNKLFLKEIIY